MRCPAGTADRSTKRDGNMQWYIVAASALPAERSACKLAAEPNSAVQAARLLETALAATSQRSDGADYTSGSDEECCVTPRASQGSQTMRPAASWANLSNFSISSEAASPTPVCPSAPLRPKPCWALVPACDLNPSPFVNQQAY